MNERIEELAEQADDLADIQINQPGEYHPDWHHVRDEKFAELIVAECARIVTDAVDHCEPASTYADKIKEHFGVE
jgi:hypothetical protein